MEGIVAGPRGFVVCSGDKEKAPPGADKVGADKLLAEVHAEMNRQRQMQVRFFSGGGGDRSSIRLINGHGNKRTGG